MLQLAHLRDHRQRHGALGGGAVEDGRSMRAAMQPGERSDKFGVQRLELLLRDERRGNVEQLVSGVLEVVAPPRFVAVRAKAARGDRRRRKVRVSSCRHIGAVGPRGHRPDPRGHRKWRGQASRARKAPVRIRKSLWPAVFAPAAPQLLEARKLSPHAAGDGSKEQLLAREVPKHHEREVRRQALVERCRHVHRVRKGENARPPGRQLSAPAAGKARDAKGLQVPERCPAFKRRTKAVTS